MEIVSGQLKDLPEIIALANLVFRPQEKSLTTEVPLMWEKENVEKGNLFVVKENKKIVSLVGLTEEKVDINGYQIEIGNIGSVSTHPEYRGKGYATKLLQQAIKKAKKDGLTYLMISGDRGLYRRAGAWMYLSILIIYKEMRKNWILK